MYARYVRTSGIQAVSSRPEVSRKGFGMGEARKKHEPPEAERHNYIEQGFGVCGSSTILRDGLAQYLTMPVQECCNSEASELGPATMT